MQIFQTKKSIFLQQNTGGIVKDVAGIYSYYSVSKDYKTSFLRMLFGMAFLLTMIVVVLYATNGCEKYQKPS